MYVVKQLAKIYADTSQPIYFVECGYSSSPVCNSSEAIQAAFFQAVFSSWDEHKSNVKYISIFKLNDWSLERCQELSGYYGINDTIFIEYLHGLGVREWTGDGIEKDAMYAIRCELASRNWCNTQCLPWGVENHVSWGIHLYPNPSDGIIVVELQDVADGMRAEIYNTSGQMMASRPLNELKSTLSLPESPGLYLVRVFGKYGLRTFRVIRE